MSSSDARLIDTAFIRYDGPRSGRLAAIWSLARWSAMRALGARRGWKVKVIPIALTLLAFAPALVILGLRALFGTSSITKNIITALPYSNYVATVSVIVLAFTVVITPELVCPDRRDRTLSLYFSTAVSRFDYLAGKILAALLLVTMAPVLLLYVGTILFAVHPLGYVQHHWLDVPRIVGSGLIVAVFFALVGLAISSLTSRRAFAVGGYLAFLAIPTVIGGVLGDALNHHGLHVLAFAASPIKAGQGLFPGYSDPSGISAVTWASVAVEVSALALGILAFRYGREQG
jgi:ABC-2 type transport system permease protein